MGIRGIGDVTMMCIGIRVDFTQTMMDDHRAWPLLVAVIASSSL